MSTFPNTPLTLPETGTDSLKLVRLPDNLLPPGIRCYDGITDSAHLWPGRVMNRKALIRSLEELSPPGTDRYQLLIDQVRVSESEQGSTIRKAALPILYKDCNTMCPDGCDCYYCSSPLPDQTIVIGPRLYVRVKSAFSFEKKKKDMERMWSKLMSEYRNSQPGTVEYDIVCHGHQLMLAMEHCGQALDLSGVTLQMKHLTPSPTTKKRRSTHGDNSSSKLPKHGDHYGEVAKAVGESNVSLSGNGTSTNSQYSQSRQSDIMASGDDISSLSGDDSCLSDSAPSSNSRGAKKRYDESLALKVGSRLVLNTTTPITKGPNTRTCLLDAVMTLLQSNVHAIRIRKSIIASMPPTGDTPISVATRVLSQYGIGLQTVTSMYHHRSGGIAYNVIQEHQCKLILRIKLTNLGNGVSYHVVAWDGTFIYDRPVMSKVSPINDRKTVARARAVFSKLYRKFKDWRIIHVYKLVDVAVEERQSS